MRNGAQAYLACSKPSNGGTKIYSNSGDVERAGNCEIPMRTPFATLLERAGGVRAGRERKAVIPGGSSAPVLSALPVRAMIKHFRPEFGPHIEHKTSPVHAHVWASRPQ
jgi:NADH:ubiquinone oxidoreductase subunit F (NADH-binding)